MENISKTFWITAFESVQHHESASLGDILFIYHLIVALNRAIHTQLYFDFTAISIIICCNILSQNCAFQNNLCDHYRHGHMQRWWGQSKASFIHFQCHCNVKCFTNSFMSCISWYMISWCLIYLGLPEIEENFGCTPEAKSGASWLYHVITQTWQSNMIYSRRNCLI